jgi:hypothetical protein
MAFGRQKYSSTKRSCELSILSINIGMNKSQ